MGVVLTVALRPKVTEGVTLAEAVAVPEVVWLGVVLAEALRPKVTEGVTLEEVVADPEEV